MADFALEESSKLISRKIKAISTPVSTSVHFKSVLEMSSMRFSLSGTTRFETLYLPFKESYFSKANLRRVCFYWFGD